ncbi:MAG: secondary thiamine-phosphate synthase enzyme YjbQ [Phycisphaerae bacterium]|nr:secondary thiamine-phosphate synthase enzyme YjbQ [Phycisphaerae bacterium]
MIAIQKELGIRTGTRSQMIDITGQVASMVAKSGIRDGDVVVFCPHTTAAVTINENADPDVVHDVLLTLSDVLPQGRPGYRHNEGNSDAHCKSSLVGCSVQVLVQDGRLRLGTWQAIYFCEFDGPRPREVLVQIRGE